jgi:hypothetical protein
MIKLEMTHIETVLSEEIKKLFEKWKWGGEVLYGIGIMLLDCYDLELFSFY